MQVSKGLFEIRNHLKQASVINQLPAESMETLVLSARIESFDRSTLLLNAGQRPDVIRYVTSGHIELIRHNEAGEAVVLSIIGKDQWATWLLCFNDEPPTHDFYAAAKSRIIAIPIETVRQIADKNPSIYRHVISEIGGRFRLLLDWIEHSAMLEGTQKLAKLIYIQARMITPDSDSGYIVMTQSRLSRLAGNSRQTTNTILAELEKLKLIKIAYGRIEIPSLDELNKFVSR